MLAAPTGRVKDFGIDGGSSPNWAGRVVEGPCGFQDGPSVGAKVPYSTYKDTRGTAATSTMKEGKLKNEIETASAGKKKSSECDKTDPLWDTLLPSETDRVVSVENNFQKNSKEPQKM